MILEGYQSKPVYEEVNVTLGKKLKNKKEFCLFVFVHQEDLANTENLKSGRLVAQTDVIQKMVLNTNNPSQSNKHRSPIISPNSPHTCRIQVFKVCNSNDHMAAHSSLCVLFNLFILVGNIVTVSQDV